MLPTGDTCAPLSCAGQLGFHKLRRLDLPSAALGEAAPGGDGPEAVLMFQEQAVLRTVCVADQYLHASQRVTASMRIHVKVRGRRAAASREQAHR